MSNPGDFRRAPSSIATHDQRRQWLASEKQALIALAGQVTHTEYLEETSQRLDEELRRSGPWTAAEELHGHAAELARRRGDAPTAVAALIRRGIVLQRLDRNEQAKEVLADAVDSAKVNELEAEMAIALNHMGMALRRLPGGFRQGFTAHGRAMRILRHLGSPALVDAQMYLAVCQFFLGNYRSSTNWCRRTIALPDLGDAERRQFGIAYATSLMAMMSINSGRPDEGMEGATRALALYKDLGHDHGVAQCQYAEGVALVALTRTGEGADRVQTALHAFERLESRQGVASALRKLGAVHAQTGRMAEAQELLHRSLVHFVQLRSNLGQAEASNDMGGTLLLEDGHDQAKPWFQRAQDHAIAAPSWFEEARAIAGLLRCGQTPSRLLIRRAELEERMGFSVRVPPI